MNDQQIEQEIQANGLTAPRVTLADLDANIVAEHYFTASDGVLGAIYAASEDGDIGDAGAPVSLSLLTFCVLVLRNGFTVTGESACASPENFNAELGRKIARENAINKVWPLMGYALKERLHAEQTRPMLHLAIDLTPDEIEDKIEDFKRKWNEATRNGCLPALAPGAA